MSTLKKLRAPLRMTLAAAMVGVGVLHFVNPEPFIRIVPPAFGDARLLVYVSGVFEVLGGLGLLIERTRRAARDGEIGALDVVSCEHGGESGVRRLALGGYHDAGRVLVEAVNNARTGDAADAGQLGAAMKQQCVDQRATLRAARGVNHEAGRLVDDDEVLVLEHDIERDILWLGLRIDRRGQVDGVGDAGEHLCGRIIGPLAVGGNAALLDQDAQARAGHAGSGVRQPFVEARARGFRRGGQAQGCGLFCRHAFVVVACEVGIRMGPNPVQRINP